MLHTYDVDEHMVGRTRERAARAELTNVVVEHRDVLAQGFDLPNGSQDGCLLFNILHHEDPVGMLSTAAEVLRPWVVSSWSTGVMTPGRREAPI